MYYTASCLIRRNDRKSKPWVGILKYKDSQGKWREKRKTFSGVRYKRDAKKLLEAWRVEMEEKSAHASSGQFVRDAILEYLALQHKMHVLSNATYSNQRKVAEWGIFPYLGDMRLSNVTRNVLQCYIFELSGRYSPKSVRTISAILLKTCKAAYRDGKLLQNITEGLELPDEKGREISYLDRGGREVFFMALKEDSTFFLPASIAFYTGMRAGEVCALRWDDIDFEANIVRVLRSAKVYKDGNGEKAIEISDTKTYKSRTVPLLPQLRKILLESREKENHGTNSYVINRRDPHLLCTSFLKWSQRNKVLSVTGKPISMHGLRHTFATMAVQAGMDVKSLSSILGHSSAAMTLDVYASADEHAKQVNMKLLGELLAGEGAASKD